MVSVDVIYLLTCLLTYLRDGLSGQPLYCYPGVRVGPEVGVGVSACRGVELVLSAGGRVQLLVSVKRRKICSMSASKQVNFNTRGAQNVIVGLIVAKHTVSH